ncbi:MAG TPA: Hsp20/alpha crystallin family protein, partial [Terriglobales bacterium]|nr:Hsp20/alpha crystallin family protein [Terriglobales bacterium]
MSPVKIEKCTDWATMPQAVSQKIEGIMDAIRNKAYSLFQARNGNGGSEFEDWLQAERETIAIPSAELLESDKDVRLKVAVPGFSAKEIEVTATPSEFVVRAESSHTHEGQKANVTFCEFGDKALFRRIALPTSIDVDKVSASLEDGILQVAAPKAEQKRSAAA